MRLKGEQEPALGRSERETLQEEQMTNANTLDWERDWQVQGSERQTQVYPSVRKLRMLLFL